MWILRRGVMVKTFLVLILVCLVEFGVAWKVYSSETYEGPATFLRWERSGDDITMRIDCNGREALVEDSRFILNYLNSPGSIEARLFKSGRVKVKLVSE